MSALIKNLLMGDYKRITDVRDYRAFFSVGLMALLSGALHLAYLVIYAAWVRQPELLAAQSAGLIACLAALLFNRAGARRIPAYILTIEIGAISIIWTVMIGRGTLLYWFTVCGMLAHFLFIEWEPRMRNLLTIYLLACFNSSLIIGLSHTPWFQLKDDALFFVALFTANAVFFTIFVELSMNAMLDRAVTSAHHAKLDKARNDSMTDTLTGLWNRRYISENEREILAAADASLSCAAILDIDYFKEVNDTHGHEVGDRILKHFAALLKQAFRKTDTAVRWGGEEFVLLLFGVTPSRAKAMLDSFRDVVKRNPLVEGGLEIEFAFTAGVCELRPDAPVNESVGRADMLLYRGKQSGRDQVVAG